MDGYAGRPWNQKGSTGFGPLPSTSDSLPLFSNVRRSSSPPTRPPTKGWRLNRRSISILCLTSAVFLYCFAKWDTTSTFSTSYGLQSLASNELCSPSDDVCRADSDAHPPFVSGLFEPLVVGPNMTLQHRVVLAPLTRYRALPGRLHIHDVEPSSRSRIGMAVEYYSQRARRPGTLLVTEGTFISEDAGGFDSVPGIWSREQIAAWRKITDAVHEEGSYIFCQLWALGRAASPHVFRAEGHGYTVVSSSNVPLSYRPPDEAPRALTVEEIHAYVEKYTQAANNAIEAGFDGVEVHGANGYLVDQFLQSNANRRTDEYGGSVENRTRFAREIIASIVAAIGQERTAIRFSPWSRFQEMRMPDPVPTFTSIIQHLATKYPNLAYVSLIEARVFGDFDSSDVGVDHPASIPSDEDGPYANDFARKILRESSAKTKLLSGGGYSRDIKAAKATAKDKGDLIAFGRAFIANPDLPYRLKHDIPLTPYDRSTFYTPGPKGYIGFPFASES